MGSVPNNESPDLCRSCGGACCRTRPGIEAPERFTATGDPSGALAAALATGCWVLESHWGVPYDPEMGPAPAPDRLIRYPRPATLAERSACRILAATETGTCVFLGEVRCVLPFSDRPHLCQTLEPDVAFECASAWSRRDAALAWLPHQEAVAEALRCLGHEEP